MKERGILFSADMVRALLDGRKTQTRRIVNVSRIKPSRWTSETIGRIAVDGAGFRAKTTTYNIWSNLFVCPYGVAGDRLWVRETFALHDRSEPPIVYYRADDTAKYESDGRWKPSIFMPRKFSRITLEIIGVRVERVQDISEGDAVAEGMPRPEQDRWAPLRNLAL